MRRKKKVVQKNVSDNKDELSDIFSTLGIEKEHQNEKKEIEKINIKETGLSNNEPHPDLFKFDQQNSLSVEGYLPKSNTIITSNDISADTSAPSNEQTKKKKKNPDPKLGKVTEMKKKDKIQNKY